MYKDHTVTMVMARDLDHTVGIDNRLPWSCKADLAHFRKLTTNNVCIMGRKTFESLPKPLQKRTVIVLSEKPSPLLIDRIFNLDNHTLAPDVETALGIAYAVAKHEREIMIVGGPAIYDAFLSFVDRAHISVIMTTAQAKEGETLVKYKPKLPNTIDVVYKAFYLGDDK